MGKNNVHSHKIRLENSVILKEYNSYELRGVYIR